MRTTAVVDLLGDDSWDPQLDASNGFRGRFGGTGYQDGRDVLEKQHLLVWFLYLR